MASSQRKSFVRFDEHQNTTVMFSTAAYSSDLWYRSEDYSRWKDSCRSEARSFRQRGLGILLNETFEKPSTNAQRCITAFAQFSDEDCLRGIERYTSKKHDEERTGMKQRAIFGLLAYQRRLRKRGNNNPEDIAEELSLLLQDYARPATSFAFKVGKADEIVAWEGDKPLEARELAEELHSASKAARQLARWGSSGSTNAQVPRRPVRSACQETAVSAVTAPQWTSTPSPSPASNLPDRMEGNSFRSFAEELEATAKSMSSSSLKQQQPLSSQDDKDQCPFLMEMEYVRESLSCADTVPFPQPY